MQSCSVESSSILGASLDLSKELMDSKGLPVIFCVGESGSGAVFSKMVAELLVLKYDVKAYVYGKNKSNINEKNLSQAISFAENRHRGSKIILVVSKYVGAKEEDLIYYGKGKTLIDKKILGDYSIIVGINLNRVWGGKKISLNRLADKTAKIISTGIEYYKVIKECNKKLEESIVWSV